MLQDYANLITQNYLYLLMQVIYAFICKNTVWLGNSIMIDKELHLPNSMDRCRCQGLHIFWPNPGSSLV